MNTAPLSPSPSKEIANPSALDVLIVVGLLLLAWLGYFVTPEFAANLPQDGIDFAMPAVNLLERGRLVSSAYGHDFPSAHPFGTSLLLLPSYMLRGHFLGNGIYSIFCCAFGAIALTYVIGVRLGGRLCGCFAAFFLITNYGFWQYSQKIMSEMPSVSLATASLALLLASRDRKRPALMWLAAGGVLGFAIMVRYDNILLLTPSLVLLLWDDTWRERLRRAGSFAIGLAPFVIVMAAYHQVTFGSPWRTSYRYWGLAGTTSQPLFSGEYVTKSGFMHLRSVEPGLAETIDGNGSFYAKSLLAELDTSRIFGHPIYWQLPSRRLYQMLVLLRTALGVVGLLACLVGWRTNPVRQTFLLWLVVSTFTFIFFYLLYCWQEERFLLRLVPAFCLMDAIGVTVLLALWPAKVARATVMVVVGALILKLAFLNSHAGFPTGNDTGLYTTLTYCAQHMESNAVVVSNFDPLRVNAYVIRGTDRIAVPLGRVSGINVFVGGDASPTSLHPFVASEDSTRLREFLHSGRSVYWIISDPWTKRRSPEFNMLHQSFRLEPLAAGVAKDGVKQPFFGRLYELTEQQRT
jgi:4-amino-4-deoxy-L-arabinose transferase-like glycosyltransferase